MMDENLVIPASVELDDESFNLIRHLIYDFVGIHLKDTKKLMVRNRLAKRLKFLHLNSFKKYLDYIQNPQNEMEFQEFINVITTNKTDFFREFKQFVILREEVLPEIEEKNSHYPGQKNLRIWSSACSSGEEAYSIAMTCNEYFEPKKDWQFKVLASDINSQVLEHAAAGIYSQTVLEPVPMEHLRKYFLKGVGQNEGFFQVKELLKNRVMFRQINLFMPEFPIRKDVDIIFCRNVAIYFDKPKKIELFKKFYELLRPGGYLFIGHSESLNNINQDFKFYKNNIYKKA